MWYNHFIILNYLYYTTYEKLCQYFLLRYKLKDNFYDKKMFLSGKLLLDITDAVTEPLPGETKSIKELSRLYNKSLIDNTNITIKLVHIKHDD